MLILSTYINEARIYEAPQKATAHMPWEIKIISSWWNQSFLEQNLLNWVLRDGKNFVRVENEGKMGILSWEDGRLELGNTQAGM